MRPYALKAGEGWTYRYDIEPRGDFTVKAGEREPGRGAAFFEYTAQKGDEPPKHTHATEDEIFYVLKGELTVYCGGESFDVGEGGFVYLPQGIEHGFTIRSEGPVRLIVVTVPIREVSGKGWGGFVANVEGQARLVAEPGKSS